MAHGLFLPYSLSSDMLPSHYLIFSIASLPPLLQILANVVTPGNLSFKTPEIPL